MTKHFLDIRATRIFEGTDEIMDLKIASGVPCREFEAYKYLDPLYRRNTPGNLCCGYSWVGTQCLLFGTLRGVKQAKTR